MRSTGAGTSGYGPLAADGGGDGAGFLEVCHGFVDGFAVNAGQFGDFAGVQGFASVAHGFQDFFFIVHSVRGLSDYSVPPQVVSHAIVYRLSVVVFEFIRLTSPPRSLRR